MRSFLVALALASALVSQSALAGSPCGSATTPQAPTPPAPAAQAQRPQSTRSFSYQAPQGVTIGPSYRFRNQALHNSFGWRPASSKALGNY